ncbi:hypothetical protein OTU49_003307 [Cherax quadricarinatus]|uniref:Major facilitator superfamily (MFS) profile domain-containing protein n=2 Tax=Cherax quadricarinatus TaxID=27406 RepID=A0AAW0XPR2_CHEQU
MWASNTLLVGDSRISHTAQYLATISVTLGGLLMGTGIGYSSPAGPLLMSNSTEGGSLQLSEDQYNWFSSLMNLGALVGGVLGGFSINRLGRRFTMLVSGPIYLTGWALIGFGQNFATLVAGRMVVGACICATCVVVPTYVGEIASPDIRGILGTSYQFMITLGMLYVYTMGVFVTNWRWLAALSAVPAVPYFLSVIFIHESHTFLLAKGKLEQATASLQHFRGKHYDVQKEINMIQQSLEDAKNNKPSLKEFLRPHNLKPFVLCLIIFVSIQMSGLGPVLFNMSFIFKASGADLDDNVSTAIVGVVQILATALSCVLVDKAGRKLLLIVSAAAVSLSLLALAEYFYMEERNSEWTAKTLGWLPLTSLVIFIAAFSIGLGPVPWVLMGEMFSPRVKSITTGIINMAGWFASFVMTLTFLPLRDVLHDDGVYLLFACVAFCILLVLFLALPETKGMTLQEITAYFGGPKFDSTRRDPSKKNDTENA